MPKSAILLSAYEAADKLQKLDLGFSSGYSEELKKSVATLISFVRSIESPDNVLQLLQCAGPVIKSDGAAEAAKPLSNWLQNQCGADQATVILKASNGNLLMIQLSKSPVPAS